MKQACSLESMVDAVLSEMKRRGNAKNTIERHERAYSQFYEYALTQGENSYSKVLARSFLEEKEKLSAYRGPRFMEQYRIALNKLDDIAKGQDIRLRHLENGYHLKSSCFDWVIPFFEERLKRRLKNTYDVRTRLRILSLFLSFVETQNAKKLEDISINHIAAAFEASTDQNHFRSTIREFLSFAAENGWMPTNLSCFVPKIRRHRGVPTVYSTDDIETCLASIDRTTQSGKRTYAVLLICARLGLRNTDACELKFSDIDWVKKTISIVQMKTGIPLVLPLLPEIEDAINRYIAARPQSDLSFIFLRHKAPYYLFNESSYSPHSFRHSKAVHLLEAGTELVYIRDFLGHVSVQTTEIYATVSQSMLNSVLRNRSIPKVLNVDLDEISHDAIPDYLRKKK